MKTRIRSLRLEKLEDRMVLDGAGLGAPQADLASYIVVLNDDVANAAEAARAMVPSTQGEVGFVYEHALKGFSATFSAAAAEALSNNPRVKYVELNGVMQASEQTVPTGVDRIDADTNAIANIDGNDDPDGNGERVDIDVAIIDTGIDFDHPDLNVVGGAYADESGGRPRSRTVTMIVGDEGAYNDGNGHGSHVAGTVGALDNDIGAVGVAPGARLWAVKVLEDNGSGSYAQVIAGIDWVAGMAGTIEVANLSLGGSFSQSVNNAIAGLVDAGVFVAVAAGNSGADAANYSPASEDSAFTVSAAVDTDGVTGGLGVPSSYGLDDTLASFSNYGEPIDGAAPGVNIYSTWKDGGYNTISGTSMASPHVAGAAALYIAANSGFIVGDFNSEGEPIDVVNVAGVRDALLSDGQPMADWRPDAEDTNSDPDGSHEVMVYVGADPLVVNLAPTVEISSPYDGATFDTGESIEFAGTASDVEDGNLTSSLSWISDIDGTFASGASDSFVLSDGFHTITASVTDSGGATGQASITIIVGEPTVAAKTEVLRVDYTLEGGKSKDRNLLITPVLADNLGEATSGATVSITLTLTVDGTQTQTWGGAATTDSDGIVTFKLRNAPYGDYETKINDVVGESPDWDGLTPANGTTKSSSSSVGSLLLSGSSSLAVGVGATLLVDAGDHPTYPPTFDTPPFETPPSTFPPLETPPVDTPPNPNVSGQSNPLLVPDPVPAAADLTLPGEAVDALFDAFGNNEDRGAVSPVEAALAGLPSLSIRGRR